MVRITVVNSLAKSKLVGVFQFITNGKPPGSNGGGSASKEGR